MTSLKGKLLVASPALVDPNFLRTVVLVAEHGDSGAMGVVLNRPTDVVVVEAIPELEPLVGAEDRVFSGGPVEQSSILALAEFADGREAASPVFGAIGFVPAGSDAALLAADTSRARVFAGYAGWGPEQLESELEETSWIVADPVEEDVFTPAPDELWASVLRRKGGRFALLATMPLDPSVN